MSGAAVLALAKTQPAHAAAQTISVFSGNTLIDAANANYSKNLTTTVNGGSAVYSNNATLLYSTSYSTTTHLLGTLSTPAAAGTGNSYSSTASVTRDSGLIGYDGGTVANAGALSPFSSATGGGDAGYYLFQVPLALSGVAAGQAYGISGAIHSDNETFDVILDYGTAGATALTLSGTKIRGITNDATTDGTFNYNATQTTANASHTISYVVYNQSGAMTTSFSVTAATPEPASLSLLLGTSLPGAAGLVLARRRKNRIR